jgi:4-alpha-glucanotransferase
MATGLGVRSAGVLLHPSSLPGPREGGELGPAAHAFLEFLAAAGARWWQMLPVGPTGYGNSPYSALSAFAGNPALISVDRLVEDGLLGAGDAAAARTATDRHIALRRAFAAFRGGAGGTRVASALERFREAEQAWLPDFVLYRALKRAHGEVEWTRWPAPLRDRQGPALERARGALAEEIAFAEFEQLRFDDDWRALRAAAASRGIGLIGDLPIFVAHDSADVWQHRELYHLDGDGQPTVVAGVPPDYFSATGQRWGNPLYRWRRMAVDGYAWWVARFRSALGRFDAVRLDHFIGFSRAWQVPASEPTAARGRWVKGPGAALFQTVTEAFGGGPLPFIAEDLGLVTPAVTRLRRRFGLPGIKIFQFAFGTDPQAPRFLPHNYPRRAVVYTGTHDNDTAAGWFGDRGGPGTPRAPEQAEKERRALLRYLGSEDVHDIHWQMIREVLRSVARLAVIPVQDLLGLGSEARMNRPGIATGNWAWRLEPGTPGLEIAARLRAMLESYGRLTRS